VRIQMKRCPRCQQTFEDTLKFCRLDGATVDISKRVASNAGVGEVLLTNAVVDLVSGSGVAFADKGGSTLEGLPKNCRLFALV